MWDSPDILFEGMSLLVRLRASDSSHVFNQIDWSHFRAYGAQLKAIKDYRQIFRQLKTRKQQSRLAAP